MALLLAEIPWRKMLAQYVVAYVLLHVWIGVSEQVDDLPALFNNLHECRMEPTYSPLQILEYSGYLLRHINVFTGERWTGMYGEHEWDQAESFDYGTQPTWLTYGALSSSNWAWTVAIVKNDSYICSGVLIANDLVLTNAHCIMDITFAPNTTIPVLFEEYRKDFIQNYFQVLAGYSFLNLLNNKHDNAKYLQAFTAVLNPDEIPYHQVIGVKVAIPHSSYINYKPDYQIKQKKRGSKVDIDLAMLKLDRPINISRFSRPICMVDRKYYTHSACTDYIFAGFGPSTEHILKDDLTLADQMNMLAIKPRYEWIATRYGPGTDFTYLRGYRNMKNYDMFLPSAASGCDRALHEKWQSLLKNGSMDGYGWTEDIFKSIGLVPKICTAEGWSGSPIMFLRNQTAFLYAINQGCLYCMKIPKQIYRTYGQISCAVNLMNKETQDWVKEWYAKCKADPDCEPGEASSGRRRASKRTHPPDL